MAETFREPKRARRRRDLARMKAKARRAWPDAVNPHIDAEHMAWCARGCCANPRRFDGAITVQERRAAPVDSDAEG